MRSGFSHVPGESSSRRRARLFAQPHHPYTEACCRDATLVAARRASPSSRHCAGPTQCPPLRFVDRFATHGNVPSGAPALSRSDSPGRMLPREEPARRQVLQRKRSPERSRDRFPAARSRRPRQAFPNAAALRTTWSHSRSDDLLRCDEGKPSSRRESGVGNDGRTRDLPSSSQTRAVRSMCRRSVARSREAACLRRRCKSSFRSRSRRSTRALPSAHRPGAHHPRIAEGARAQAA